MAVKAFTPSAESVSMLTGVAVPTAATGLGNLISTRVPENRTNASKTTTTAAAAMIRRLGSMEIVNIRCGGRAALQRENCRQEPRRSPPNKFYVPQRGCARIAYRPYHHQPRGLSPAAE